MQQQDESVVSGEFSDAQLSSNARDGPSVESLGKHGRQAEYHQIFKSIPEDELLIESYSCALNREILVQGRMFIGEGHICFYANILGWVTSVVISFRDIVAIDKRNTALLFPNAIQIATLHHRYFFTSFVFREQAFAKMTRVWKQTIGEKSETYIHGPPEQELGDDMFRDDVRLAVAPRMPPVSAPQPFAPFHHVSSSLQGSASDDGKTMCGCNAHLSNEALSLVIEMPLASVHSALFESGNSFWPNFYQTISYENATVGDSEWETPLCGSEQRKYTISLPLPAIFGSRRPANGRVTEKYLLKQPAHRYVAEATFELGGVPGGQAQVVARYCLSAQEDVRTRVLVTFDAFPPRTSFFKESIKQSLTVQFSEFYECLGRAMVQMAARFAGTAGEAPPIRRLSWWRQRRALPGEYSGSASTTTVRTYFDWDAFWQSFIWLIPVIVLFIAILCVHLMDKPTLGPLDAAARLQKVQSIQSQFRSFIEEEHVSTSALRTHVNDMVDRLAARVSGLDEHIQLIARQEHKAD